MIGKTCYTCLSRATCDDAEPGRYCDKYEEHGLVIMEEYERATKDFD